ncbi:MAG: arsinothricin resistance N-acetyltransferase ArsN1 family A [Gaiellaceae bacterium]
MRARFATDADAAAIAEIYNEGIHERAATFETEAREAEDVHPWLGGRYPVVVVANIEGEVLGFAAAFVYRPRGCYDGVAEFSVYGRRDARRRGTGRLALEALLAAAEARGFWKLVSRVFVENAPSRALLAELDFREVGVYRCHGRLDGKWRDVVIVERLLGAAASCE